MLNSVILSMAQDEKFAGQRIKQNWRLYIYICMYIGHYTTSGIARSLMADDMESEEQEEDLQMDTTAELDNGGCMDRGKEEAQH